MQPYPQHIGRDDSTWEQAPLFKGDSYYGIIDLLVSTLGHRRKKCMSEWVRSKQMDYFLHDQILKLVWTKALLEVKQLMYKLTLLCCGNHSRYEAVYNEH